MYETKIKFLKLGNSLSHMLDEWAQYRFSGENENAELNAFYSRYIEHRTLFCIRGTGYFRIDLQNLEIRFSNDVIYFYKEGKKLSTIKVQDLDLEEVIFNLAYGKVLDLIDEEYKRYSNIFESILG